jgi:hypothetical protein
MGWKDLWKVKCYSPYQLGELAWYNKWKREDCPYPKESQESIDWLDGWDETAFYGGIGPI